jgi:hypothetical protein
VADERQVRAGDVTGKLARLLLDLHRCEHGRLQGDPCLACGGPSGGNRLLPPGTTIGHTRYGDKIVVPLWEDHNDPLKWVEQD